MTSSIISIYIALLAFSLYFPSNLNNIGVVYMMMENFIKAREYYQKSYDIVSKQGYKRSMMYGLGNIGITYSYEEIVAQGGLKGLTNDLIDAER